MPILHSFLCGYVSFVWGFGVLFVSCARASVSGVLFSVDLCVCDILIFWQVRNLGKTAVVRLCG